MIGHPALVLVLEVPIAQRTVVLTLTFGFALDIVNDGHRGASLFLLAEGAPLLVSFADRRRISDEIFANTRSFRVLFLKRY